MSSASLVLSPRAGDAGHAGQEGAAAPLSAPAPPLQTHCNGGVKRDVVDGSTANVNGNGNIIVSESTYSIDVLSGGESDAGDTLNRSLKNNNSISSNVPGTLRDGSTERRRRAPTDLAYCVAKQLLMTERTYKRTLQLVTVTWSQSVSSLAGRGELVAALGRPCLALEPLALAQGGFLATLDTCLHTDESKDPAYKRIAEILCEYLSNICDAYLEYISRAGALAARVESARRGGGGGDGDALCARFEATSPLSLTTLLLRPLHAALHYRDLATELSQVSSAETSRRLDALTGRLAEAAREQLRHAENHAQLCRLHRDLQGYDKLLVAEREFLRLGCVYKNSSKGLQKRMLFLFSDILICASRSPAGGAGAQFRAHSVWPLHALRVEACELPHSFVLTDGADVTVMFSTSTEYEYQGWRASLSRAAEAARDLPRPHHLHTDVTHAAADPDHGSAVVTSSTASVTSPGAGGDALMHVCWHRATSLSREHLHLAMKCQYSGYLLRKFKSSHGWQKLWVVLALFSLHFYKSWQDDAPLASLPLLGYSLGPPGEGDAVNKEFVFKLQYKNHVYFFRADTHYTYSRWTEALQVGMLHNKKCSY